MKWKVETNIPIFLEIGIHTGSARFKLSSAGDQLKFDSVHTIIEMAGKIKGVGRRFNNHLTAVDDDSLDYALFRVEMPSPSLK